MRIVFMGTPLFAVPVLKHLILNHHQVAAVYTQADKPSGRGRALTLSPVKEAAMAFDLPLIQPASLKKPEVIEQLAGFDPDVIVVAAYGQLLPQSVLEIPTYKCINVHPSLLPKYRGAAPVAAAILAGERFTGVSVMLMEAGLDTGPVLAHAQITVSDQDTTGSLTAKLSETGARLLQEVLPGWVKGEITPRPQNEAEATYSKPISKADGEIDWRLPAIEIWRRVRAFQPWPSCFTRWQGRQLKIIEARVLSESDNLKVGEVGALGPGAFAIGTGSGVLEIIKVQLEGKRVMPAGEFLRGQRQFIGAILPS